MATNTPNLDLRQPAGTDFVSVLQDISNNMGKIDTAVGVLAISHPVLTASLSDLKTNLTNLASSKNVNDIVPYSFLPSANFEPFESGVAYFGYMFIVNASPLRFSITFNSQIGKTIAVGLNGTAWYFYELALKNDFYRETIAPGSNFNSYTVASGGKDKHYVGTDIGSMTSRPSDIASTYAYAFILDAESINGYTVQTLSIYGATVQVYRRQQYYYQGTLWTDWEKFALKSDVKKIGVQKPDCYLKKSIQISVRDNQWFCGYVIGNINGYGNFVARISVGNEGNLSVTDISGSASQVFTISISNSVMTISLPSSGNYSFAELTWIGSTPRSWL